MTQLIKGLSLGLAIILMLTVQPTAQAESLLKMEYAVTPVGPLFDYEFRLTLDTLDLVGGAPGWGWIIFGDDSSSTPLTSFVGDVSDLPIGPYSNYATTTGGHNGPNLHSASTTWFPTIEGEFLQWSGTSTADLVQGDLLFSTLTFNSGNAHVYDFDVANRVTSFSADIIPLPSASLAGVLGFGLMSVMRRKRKA